MDEIILKLNKVKDSLVTDDVLGTLFFFGLIKRVDLDDKWDILISSSKLLKNNSEKDLTYVINQLKKEFGDDINFLSRIVLLMSNEGFIADMARAIEQYSIEEGKEIIDLKIAEDFTIKQMYIICLNFESVVFPSIKEVKKNEKKNEVVNF